jgi:hypothetical protein
MSDISAVSRELLITLVIVKNDYFFHISNFLVVVSNPLTIEGA